MKAKGASGPTHSMKEGASRSFSFIEPMKALPVERLPEGDWLYEIKHDGYRALAFKDGKDVRYLSRYFGSLLVGNQSPVGLMFAGRVGTGFSEKVLANLYGKLQKLKTPSCPLSTCRRNHAAGGALESRRRSCSAANGLSPC
jgi:ATP-dependent DNA ligase